MKTLSLILSAVLFAGFACSRVGAEQRPQSVRASIADVRWLAGGWVTDANPVDIEQRWTTPAGGAMLAVSRTVEGDKMVAFEYLRIVERDGGLVYIAQPGGRPAT